jgi:hypothetical protein
MLAAERDARRFIESWLDLNIDADTHASLSPEDAAYQLQTDLLAEGDNRGHTYHSLIYSFGTDSADLEHRITDAVRQARNLRPKRFWRK